ncbi:hypothetical protein B0H66DRAFT_643968 [Apodospora peruviana]|uniref:Indole-diterpene biosynthesis protein PaxU n=1 Tax=Apodospora peruviana TaxID=516989 RepID=A0AAE0HTU0_9PEZI|nr:hypothetical protein B0H66DRAFT_643968 [Apodospora peruviana]
MAGRRRQQTTTASFYITAVRVPKSHLIMVSSLRLKNKSKGDRQASKGPKKPVFVPGFSCLGPSIYVQDRQLNASNNSTDILHRPTIPAATTSSTSLIPHISSADIGPPPDLIIITSWTGAIPKHIAKYTQSYNQLFPNTPILVITTSIADLAIHSTKHKLKVLPPAVRYLSTCPGSTTAPQSQSSEKPLPFQNILLHAFSEGGANKAVCLAQAFLSTTHQRLPIAAFIFDSTPGTPRYSSNVAAFRRSLPPNKFAQAVGLPLGAGILAVTWVVFGVVIGYENNLISKTRRALNDSDLWKVEGIPRTYIFSEADDLIWWKDVEEHGVTSANVCGARSLLVRFKKTGHCGHARGHEGIYWGAVRRTWETRGDKMVQGSDSDSGESSSSGEDGGLEGGQQVEGGGVETVAVVGVAM